MKKNDYLNTLISNITFTIDYIFKNKETSSELLNYLYLIATGMILTYGEECTEDIYNTIANIKYNLNNPKEDNLFYKNPTNHNYQTKNISFDTFKNPKYTYELQFTTIDSSSIKTLEYLTHEINYLLFNKQTLSLTENLKVRWSYLTNQITPVTLTEDKTKTIDRVWNILETEEIIKNVLALRSIKITNSKFKKALALLKDVDNNTYKTEGLDILTNLIRPLYNLNDIKSLINSPTNRKLLEKELDTILGKNSYKEIERRIEVLGNLIKNSFDNKNYYYLSLEYVAIQKDYVNKYIAKKYV